MVDKNILNEILLEFEQPNSKQPSLPIPKEKVLNWMQSDDLEVLGTLYNFISGPDTDQSRERIVPSLDYCDYYRFLTHFFDLAIRTNLDNSNPELTNDWVYSRYEAARELYDWFTEVWVDKEAPRDVQIEIKKWIGNFYKDGNLEIRTCLVNGTLEHLFENPEIAEFFSDWKEDKILMRAYSEAMEWQK